MRASVKFRINKLCQVVLLTRKERESAKWKDAELCGLVTVRILKDY